MADIVERLQSHMYKADMSEVLADCRIAAAHIEAQDRRIAETRAAALEEAASAAEHWGDMYSVGVGIARGIRALKSAGAGDAPCGQPVDKPR